MNRNGPRPRLSLILFSDSTSTITSGFKALRTFPGIYKSEMLIFWLQEEEGINGGGGRKEGRKVRRGEGLRVIVAVVVVIEAVVWIILHVPSVLCV